MIRLADRSYTHIFWDWNGTLLDDAWLCIEVMNGLLEKYRLPLLTLERYHDLFDFPVRAYYQRLGFDFEKTPFEIVGSEFMAVYHQRWRQCSLHQQAEKCLKDLAQQGISQVILSAADVSLLQQCVAHYNLTSCFDAVLGLNHHYADGKMGIARDYMANISGPPESILFIGDTLHDYQVAREIGVDCILFSGGHHSLKKLSSCGVPVIHSLSKVRDYIKCNGD